MARLVIPDVLRGVAILAMVIAHAAPFVPDRPWIVGFVFSHFNALASPLFALVMGMAAEIVWRRGGRVSTTLLQQSIRGLVLIALGVWMATWGSWVDVILAYLGLLLIVGAPMLLAKTPVLIGVTAALLLISQPLVTAARGWTWIYTAPTPIRDLMTWVLTGHNYRLVNLVPMFLIGALLLRVGLTRGRLLWALAAFTPVAYLAWPVAENLFGVQVQPADYLDTLKDLGLVFAVYVIVVLAATVTQESWKRFWDAIFAPFIACGQVALSLYLLHVWLIALWNTNYGRPVDNVYIGWLVIVPGVMAVGWLWARFIGTGPVEWLMGLISGRRKPLRPRR